MTKKADTYSVAQSALALGVSPKRVRQLIDEGLLIKHSIAPITIKQSEVIDLKMKREQAGTHRNPQRTVEASRASQTTQRELDILEKITKIMESTLADKQLSIETKEVQAQRDKDNLIAQINELKAENERLRARKWWKK